VKISVEAYWYRPAARHGQWIKYLSYFSAHARRDTRRCVIEVWSVAVTFPCNRLRRRCGVLGLPTVRVAGEITKPPRGHPGKNCSSFGNETKVVLITLFQCYITFGSSVLIPVCCVSLETIIAASFIQIAGVRDVPVCRYAWTTNKSIGLLIIIILRAFLIICPFRNKDIILFQVKGIFKF
jgi:hypothetical protein